MTQPRNSNVTLIRLIYNKRIELPLLVNLLRDDECFQKKILLTNLDYYNDSELTLLFAFCKKANFTIQCISLLNGVEPYEFIKFFDFYDTNNIVYDEKHIKNLQLLYDIENNLEVSRETIIGYMCMLVCKNYIFIGNCDRIMVAEKTLVEHINQYAYTSNKFFMKANQDVSFSGNLESKSYSEMLPYVPFLTRFKYTNLFCDEFSKIGKKNSMLLSVSKIEDMYTYEAVPTWQGVDATLQSGKFIYKIVNEQDETRVAKTNNKNLNHFLRTKDHTNYINLRNKAIEMYTQLNVEVPVNNYYE